MKIRNGFVSNSSSSSFVLDSKYLSSTQIKLIEGHKYCKTIPYAMSDKWDISWSEDKRFIILDTFLDNFDMYSYLINIVGIKEEQIMYDIPSIQQDDIEEDRYLCEEAKRILNIMNNGE